MTNVFVSSTYEDLKLHRSSVRDGIRQLGAVDISMENLGARDQRPKSECLRMVRQESDIFVGVYAHRYGFIPDGERISITESEYEAATLTGLPRYIYIVDEKHPWPPPAIDHGNEKVQLDRFKNHLLRTHICKNFTTEDQLCASVVADLGRHLAMREAPRVGPDSVIPEIVTEGADIGIESAVGEVTETPDEWNALRYSVYHDNRDVFLTHVIEPSKKPNQEFDIFIYLIRHQSEDLSNIRLAEFFLGKYWGNQVFPAVERNGFIGISTAAYGTFLCICKVTFRDGAQILLNRYIDFESKRQGG
jgi:Domain of unknown function (DUF4062)/prokaryotic YEATS domain